MTILPLDHHARAATLVYLYLCRTNRITGQLGRLLRALRFVLTDNSYSFVAHRNLLVNRSSPLRVRLLPEKVSGDPDAGYNHKRT